MADMERDRKNDYLHKDANGQWHVECPQIGNDIKYMPLPFYTGPGGQSLSLPLLRKLADAVREGIQSHHRDLLTEYGDPSPKEMVLITPESSQQIFDKPADKKAGVAKLRKKVERLILGAVAYSQHVMDSAREYALTVIETEESERPYRARIEGGILPPMPRGDVPFILARNEFEGVSGVYFIHREHHLVYVGLSENIGRRISSHRHAAESDRICIVEVPEDKLKQAEDHYIWSLRPPLNKEWKYSYEDGEFSGSPLARFVSEVQPQSTQYNTVSLAVPLPHNPRRNSTNVNFSAAVSAAARDSSVQEKAEQLYSEIADCVLESNGNPEQQVQHLIDTACSALQQKAEDIRRTVEWAKDGSNAPESEGAA